MISFKKKLQNLINIFAEKKSIFFPDGSTLSNTLKRIDVSINNPIYIPVPCNLRLTNRKKTRQSVEQNGISFCWVGRLCDFKIHILVYTIKKLSDYSVRKKKLIYMYIIGDGPKSNIIRKLNVENGFFHIINVGVLMGQSLSEYLLDNIDVLVAMGASALDGAILGIPTIRLDISYGPISEDYKFKWIFESKKYELADIIDHSHFNKNNDTLDRIIDSIDNEYSLISDKTYEYCVQNHSISSVCDKFIDALSEASFRYGDFSPDILKKGFIRKSYEFVRRIYHSFK